MDSCKLQKMLYYSNQASRWRCDFVKKKTKKNNAAVCVLVLSVSKFLYSVLGLEQ